MDTITTIQNLLKSNGSAQPVMVALMPSEFGLGVDQTLDQVSSYSGHAEGQIATLRVDDSTPSDVKEDEDLYSIKNFSI